MVRRMLVPALAVVAVLSAACSFGDDGTPAAEAPAKPPAEAPTRPTAEHCGTAVTTEPLPEWASVGFSEEGRRTPHVVSAGGGMIGVLFGPVTSSPDPAVTSKILWLSPLDDTGTPLRIQGVDTEGRTMVREVAEGPGPSSVNFPNAGCWLLTLSWSGHTDTVAVPVT
jgi:hypothetical protein